MNRAVRDFAVNLLGCGCPEEVFSSVEIKKPPLTMGGVALSFRLHIGGRLMVIGVYGESLLGRDNPLASLVAVGARARDEEGFNRLRIVAISDDPACEGALRPLFEKSAGVDDRVHLHVVGKEAVSEMLAGEERCGERRDNMEKYKTEPTVWHEMEGPFIGGREHYQEKSYGFTPLREAEEKGEEKRGPAKEE